MKPSLTIQFHWLTVLLTVGCFVLPEYSYALSSSLEGDAPVRLEAGELSYDDATSTYQASDKVRLQKGQMTLESEKLIWNMGTGEATATGGIRMTQPEGVLEADSAQYNVNKGTGRLSKAHLFVPEHSFHLAGDLLEKLGEQSYQVTNGTFTSCEGERPAWKFGARELDVTVGGYAQAKHAFFYLYDVPVLYFPYMLYPVKTERESGLLMPSGGYSKKRGWELSLAYYQVLGRNMDATLYLDYLSDLGVGKGLEYRYFLGDDNEGSLFGYHVNGVKDGGDPYALSWDHKGTLPGKVRLTVDAEYASSQAYYDDFGERPEEYNKDSLESKLLLTRNWNKLNLGGLLQYTKDLEQDNDSTLQRLPEIRLASIRQRVGDTPFFTKLDAASTYFWRREGDKAERLQVNPEVSALFRPAGFIELVPSVGYRQRFYWTSGERDDHVSDGQVELSTRLSTRLSRVFNLNGDRVKKIQHTIEPEVSYLYLSSADSDRLPFFDAEDDFLPRNRVEYALVNRFVARIESPDSLAAYHEFIFLRLSQAYDIRLSRHDREGTEGGDPLLPLRAELTVRPTRQTAADLDVRYDFDQSSIERFLAAGRVSYDEENALSVHYSYRRDEMEYVGASIDLGVLRPVYVSYEHRYSLDGSTELEKVLDLEYRAQCWSLFFTLRDRLEDTEFLVSFALGGLRKAH